MGYKSALVCFCCSCCLYFIMFLGDNIIIFPMMGDLLELYVFSPNLGFVLLVLPTPRLPLYPCAYGISYFKNIKIMNSNWIWIKDLLSAKLFACLVLLQALQDGIRHGWDLLRKQLRRTKGRGPEKTGRTLVSGSRDWGQESQTRRQANERSSQELWEDFLSQSCPLEVSLVL